MKTVVISPWSRQLRTVSKPNPKNYPYWPLVITALHDKGIRTIQIGQPGEVELETTDRKIGLALSDLKKLLLESDTWVSVDNFLGHFGNMIGKSGVVIWGKSDPAHFGYPTNTNLLKDRKYLRPGQFRWWEDVSFDPNVFVDPNVVVEAVLEKLK